MELSENRGLDKISTIEALEKRIKARIASVLGISAKVRFVEPKSIPRSQGKAVRVIEQRKI